MTVDRVVLFGGSGFIGSYIARYLIRAYDPEKIILADLNAPEGDQKVFLDPYLDGEPVEFCNVDVRKTPDTYDLPENPDLVINLAAVHHALGHEDRDYYETNIRGAEHVCDWMEQTDCSRLIFFSSSAVYGPKTDEKDETYIPQPVTPYGVSKLVAEKIHEKWQARQANRRLVMTRPGVVFGPGKQGNVHRMIQGVLGRYFVFAGNEDTVKAGCYVKDVPPVLFWALEQCSSDEEFVFNLTYSPTPTLRAYVDAIQAVSDDAPAVWNVPYPLVYSGAFLFEWAIKLIGRRTSICPDLVRKTCRSNHVVSTLLSEYNYEFSYDLESAFRDWKREKPEDWGMETTSE